MKKSTQKSIFFAALVISAQLISLPSAMAGRGNNDQLLTIYVESQGLYYDTFKTTDLPFRGRFQKLDPAGAMGPTTEFGPGDAGYIGGRWWVDTNNDGVMDELDTYFSCPLLGPGRLEP